MRRSLRTTTPAPLLAIALALTACAQGPRATFDGPVYPADAPRLETLNVQVYAEDQRLVINSGDARSFGSGEIWLNQWWAAEIDALPRGAEIAIPLSRFRNEFGLAPRGGGFFATRDADDLVLIELRTEAGLHGLKLVGPRD